MDRRRWTIPILDLVLVGVATSVVMLVVLIVPGTVRWGTTFAGGSTAALAADLAAGVALLLLGALLLQVPADRALAVTALVAGIAWFGADLAGWHDGPAIVGAGAALAAAVVAPLLLHLSVASPPGQRMSRPDTAIVLFGYVVVSILAVTAALVIDPRTDGGCWRDCRRNPLLVVHLPQLGHAVRDGLAVAMLGCGLAMAGIVVARLVGASRKARTRRWPLLGASVVLGVAIAMSAVRIFADPVLRPREPLDAAVFLVLAAAVGMFAVALAWTVLRDENSSPNWMSLASTLATP